MPFVSFSDADAIADRFLELLNRHDIRPPPKSEMENELLSLTELIEITRNPNLAQGPHKLETLRLAAGLHDLAAKILAVENIEEFDQFTPHLKLIAEAKYRSSAPPTLLQNASSTAPNDTNRKISELYVACLATLIGLDIALDSPTAAKGDNPDVMFTVLDGAGTQPRRWALAIKSISGQSGQTFFERIEGAAAQIDAPACQADHGMVVLIVKDVLKHDELWNTDFADEGEAVAALGGQLEALMAKANADRPQAEWDALFTGKVVRPILLIGQTVVRLPTAAGPDTPTPLKMMQMYGAQGSLDPVGHGIAYQLNKAMQQTLLGQTGHIGIAPR